MTRLAAVPDSPPRAVLYLRQSISREDSISLELQETAGRDYCLARGYQVLAVEADPGISGRTWERPAVKRVMGMVEAGDVDVVIVWKWSRLSRSRRDWAIAVDRIESLGGRLESATEPVDATTATGRFTRGMLAEMAAFESDRIGEVWKEVHQRRRHHGLPPTGGQRFGYQRQSDGTYTPHPIEGPMLAEAYRRIIDGHSFRSVTAWLQERGARSRDGNPITRDRLVRILDSGFGAGQLVQNGRHGNKVDRNIAARTWQPGIHPPLITDTDWQAYLARRRLTPRQPQAHTYLLSGLIACGDCGAPMWSDRLGRETGYAYSCSRWRERKDVRCVTAARHRAEAAVLAWLVEHAPGLAEQAAREVASGARQVADDAEARELAREASRLEARQQKLLATFLDGIAPAAAYAAERDSMAQQQAVIARRLDALLLARRQPPSIPTVTVRLLDDWELLPVEERRAIVEALIERVEVVPPVKRGVPGTFRIIPRA